MTEGHSRSLLNDEIADDDVDKNDAMETPQLSDISSFNPDDPQVRQIDIDSSSLSSNSVEIEGKKRETSSFEPQQPQAIADN